MADIGVGQFIRETPDTRRRVEETRRFQLPEPMLGKAGTATDLNRPDMIAETKWDGTRVMLVKRDQSVRLFVARGTHTEYTHKFPEIIADAKKLVAKNCVLDGEFIWYDRRGNDVFLTISATRETVGTKKYKYMAFDLLEYNGRDMRSLPFHERKRYLDLVIPNNLTVIKETEAIEANKKRFYEQQLANGREGVMLKTKDGPYIGGRSTSWLKIKRTNTADVIAKGATPGTGARQAYFGAIHCYLPQNGQLRHIGDVGTGFNIPDLVMLTPILRTGRPFVIEVKFMEMTPDGKMRFPSFIRVRTDKTVEDVMRYG